MSNYILRHRDDLKRGNYIRKADPACNYWLDFSFGKLQDYVQRYGDRFNLIIVGSAQVEDDFYVIPFRLLKDMLTEEFLADDMSGRRRWLAYVTDGQLHINHCPDPQDIRRFHGSITLASLRNSGTQNV
jgi:hypothetical protein